MALDLYLSPSEIIDFNHPLVADLAKKLADGCGSEEEIACKCFIFVRDEIKHSLDFRLNPITCKASDVLLHATGYCYAKSHLLAALLRANGIPAGLCYQRLLLDEKTLSYCLHGLNAVFLKQHGWYRLDPRGNKPGVCAEFMPPIEKLAFSTITKGEADLPEIWPEPLPIIVRTLTTFKTVEQVLQNMPDIELLISDANCSLE